MTWIHAAVSEKLVLTDGRTATDAYAMTVALLTKSNRAKKDREHSFVFQLQQQEMQKARIETLERVGL